VYITDVSNNSYLPDIHNVKKHTKWKQIKRNIPLVNSSPNNIIYNKETRKCFNTHERNYW
jgi:hypothetical protein